MLCPKFAPVCESCLNVSILVSKRVPNAENASPSTPRPANTPVKELIVPSPFSAAEYNPPNADDSFVINFLCFSLCVNSFSNCFSSFSSNANSSLRIKPDLCSSLIACLRSLNSSLTSLIRSS